ncbi:MAG: hypothetical protein JRD68_07700 [Deltaproteobacteria bacterium]|nr:hypothetical protein [Deltaproteobacteria bacterium]
MCETQEAVMWLYSTVSQTLGALIAVVGMLTVYKLDRISNGIGRLFEGIRDIVKKYDIDSVYLVLLYRISVEDWITKGRKEICENISLPKTEKVEIDELTNKMHKEQKERKIISIQFKNFFKTKFSNNRFFFIIFEILFCSVNSYRGNMFYWCPHVCTYLYLFSENLFIIKEITQINIIPITIKHDLYMGSFI